jgi:regulator of protease activity HflC (stomatin/prohibitin superfamily)
MRGHPCVISDNFPPNPEADKLLRMAKRMAKARQRLAADRQAEAIDSVVPLTMAQLAHAIQEGVAKSDAAKDSVVGAVADLDGMVG